MSFHETYLIKHKKGFMKTQIVRSTVNKLGLRLASKDGRQPCETEPVESDAVFGYTVSQSSCRAPS